MGGRVLELETDRILARGRQEGLEQGLEQGLKEATRRLYKKGMDVIVISETLDKPVEQIEEWLGLTLA